jgi:hypothetical protein
MLYNGRIGGQKSIKAKHEYGISTFYNWCNIVKVFKIYKQIRYLISFIKAFFNLLENWNRNSYWASLSNINIAGRLEL